MLTDARFKFALESLKKCLLMKPTSNVFFSPHLLYHNLLVVYFGAESDDYLETDLRQALYIPCDVSKAVVQQFYYIGGYNQFCYILNGSQKSYTCRILCRVLVSDTKMVYIQTLNLFSSGHQVKEVAFEINPDHAMKFINNSIKCITQQNIQNPLAESSITKGTDVVIFNTMYCKGEYKDCWIDLNLSDDSTEESTKNDKLYKSKQLNAYILELPFERKTITTFFLYPLEQSKSDKALTVNDRIIQLMNLLTTEEGSQELRRVMDAGLAQQTNLIFPTFTVEQDLRMYDLLDALGLDDLTPMGSPELHEFTSNHLHLGDALHRVKIEITMEGITATACDIFFTDNPCRHAGIKKFTDTAKPCICFIYDKAHHNILFCGAIFDKNLQRK